MREDPKHKLPEGLKAEEVYRGVPILAYQNDEWYRNRYGLSISWYGRIIDVGNAVLGKPYLDLLQDAKDAIDVMLKKEK